VTQGRGVSPLLSQRNLLDEKGEEKECGTREVIGGERVIDEKTTRNLVLGGNRG